MQVPPLFHAIQNDGKQLYDQARKEGKTEQDAVIDPSKVEIYKLKYVQDQVTTVIKVMQIREAFHRLVYVCNVAKGLIYVL